MFVLKSLKEVHTFQGNKFQDACRIM